MQIHLTKTDPKTGMTYHIYTDMSPTDSIIAGDTYVPLHYGPPAVCSFNECETCLAPSCSAVLKNGQISPETAANFPELTELFPELFI